jgi:hypothetical protein
MSLTSSQINRSVNVNDIDQQTKLIHDFIKNISLVCKRKNKNDNDNNNICEAMQKFQHIIISTYENDYDENKKNSVVEIFMSIPNSIPSLFQFLSQEFDDYPKVQNETLNCLFIMTHCKNFYITVEHIFYLNISDPNLIMNMFRLLSVAQSFIQSLLLSTPSLVLLHSTSSEKEKDFQNQSTTTTTTIELYFTIITKIITLFHRFGYLSMKLDKYILNFQDSNCCNIMSSAANFIDMSITADKKLVISLILKKYMLLIFNFSCLSTAEGHKIEQNFASIACIFPKLVDMLQLLIIIPEQKRNDDQTNLLLDICNIIVNIVSHSEMSERRIDHKQVKNLMLHYIPKMPHVLLDIIVNDYWRSANYNVDLTIKMIIPNLLHLISNSNDELCIISLQIVEKIANIANLEIIDEIFNPHFITCLQDLLVAPNRQNISNNNIVINLVCWIIHALVYHSPKHFQQIIIQQEDAYNSTNTNTDTKNSNSNSNNILEKFILLLNNENDNDPKNLNTKQCIYRMFTVLVDKYKIDEFFLQQIIKFEIIPTFMRILQKIVEKEEEKKETTIFTVNTSIIKSCLYFIKKLLLELIKSNSKSPLLLIFKLVDTNILERLTSIPLVSHEALDILKYYHEYQDSNNNKSKSKRKYSYSKDFVTLVLKKSK